MGNFVFLTGLADCYQRASRKPIKPGYSYDRLSLSRMLTRINNFQWLEQVVEQPRSLVLCKHPFQATPSVSRYHCCCSSLRLQASPILTYAIIIKSSLPIQYSLSEAVHWYGFCSMVGGYIGSPYPISSRASTCRPLASFSPVGTFRGALIRVSELQPAAPRYYASLRLGNQHHTKTGVSGLAQVILSC